MDASQTERVQLHFDNLPLIEAALRFSFESEHDLTIGTATQIQAQLGDEFTELDIPHAIESPPGIASRLVIEANQPQAFRLSDGKRGLSITLQRQLLAVRWVFQSGDVSPEYPRYAALKDTLAHSLEAMRTVCQQVARVSVANMLYLNFVQTDDPSHEFVRGYLAKDAQLPIMGETGGVQQITGAWRQASNLDLRFDLRPGTSSVHGSGFRLLTAAGVKLDHSDDPLDVADRIHNGLQTFFRSLLTKRAKDEWGFSEESI